MSFARYSDLLVENREFFLPHLYLAPPQGVTPSEFCQNVKMFDAGKTRMIGLPYGEKNYDDMLNRFHLIPERHGRTDRQTDRFAISIKTVHQWHTSSLKLNGCHRTSRNLFLPILA